MRLAPFLLAALVTLPLSAAAKPLPVSPTGKAASAVRTPGAAWKLAEAKLAEGHPDEAVAELRRAIDSLARLPEGAHVTSATGERWTRQQAIYAFNVRAGEAAMLVDFRDALPYFRAAMAHAPGKLEKRDASIQLEAAEKNLAVGIAKSPSFLGDDLEAIAPEPTEFASSVVVEPAPVTLADAAPAATGPELRAAPFVPQGTSATDAWLSEP